MTKQFKINPDLTCPELAGYRLPPFPRCHEDDVDAMALDEYEQAVKRKGQEYAGGYYEGIIDGYNKAREKYEFSREDMHKLADWILKLTPRQKVSVWSKSGESNSGLFDMDGEQLADKFIEKNIRTQRTPIAIEVEMVVEVEPNTGTEMGEYPATHPDETVKGRWVYE